MSKQSNPSPIEVRALRKSVGLTQTQAAELIQSNLRTWQGWEGGITRMHPGLFELFKIKTGLNKP